ncbi:glycosyltransferase family 2 protein [Candidatus Shapirobacteria bacterium]|nr:glycosyltransferase family 2 protein [Candidatus Shapirobacteria bacterium]
MTKVGIIILNWQQAELTIQTLESLQQIKHPNFTYQTYLIDNGSGDNSVELLNKYLKKFEIRNLKFEINSRNLGFADGNNFGINLAQKDNCDYILLLNNDVLVDKNFLSELLKPFATDAQLGMVGPKIYFAKGKEFHHDRYTATQLGKVIWSAGGKIDWANVYGQNIGLDEVDTGQYDNYRNNFEFTSNCCILFKTACLRKTGLMPTDYFMYCEDMDFCQMFIKSGYKIGYVPTAKIWHINSGSTSAGGGSFHDYYLTRNRLIFGYKYTNLRTKFALVRESFRLLFTGTPWQKRGVIDFFLGVNRKGSWHK